MPIKKLLKQRQTLLLLGSILALSSCETITLKDRTSCFVNGEISLGSTCAHTIGESRITQLTLQETLDFLEARPEHPPAVYESASDYGEETIELETACRLLGNHCSYSLQTTVENHHKILKAIREIQTQSK